MSGSWVVPCFLKKGEGTPKLETLKKVKARKACKKMKARRKWSYVRHVKKWRHVRHVKIEGI